jgi:hypothetical protein
MTLAKLWNKAVYGYQAARQELNRHALAATEERLREARAGYQTIVPYTPSFATGGISGIVKVKLEPEAQAVVIAREEGTRDRLQAAMAARREKYGLTI